MSCKHEYQRTNKLLSYRDYVCIYCDKDMSNDDYEELRDAYIRGYNAAKEQASKLLLDNFTCSDYPRCDHEWCAYLLELSDAIQQMQTEEVK